ncbi:hypothetical protein AAMO2058_000302300 [Amorphochlora amoebiformis]
MGVPGIRANLALARLAEETARASTKMPAYETYDEESFARVPQKKGRNVAVILSVVLNVVLLAGIAFVLFSGSSQLGAPMMTRTTTPSVARVPVRNVAAYAKKPDMMKLNKMGPLSAATSAAVMTGIAKAAEAADAVPDYIYQEGANPPLVEFAWGMFGAMFTFSIALVVFGRSGL